MKRIKALLVFAGLAVLICTSTLGHAAQKKITFCVYASDKPSVMHKKVTPIIDYLQKNMNSGSYESLIAIKIYPSYNKAIDALVEGRCDFSRFGPASYIIAKERNDDIRLLVMEHKKGKMSFDGVFIVPMDSPIKSIAQLKGKTFAFGNRNSTIGRYLSQAELVKAGVFASDLKSYRFLDRHDKVALAVAAGNYDAGVVKENTYNKYAEDRGLRIIGRFPNVTKPWVARAGFDNKYFKAIQKSLLELNDTTILKELKQDGFLTTSDKEYDAVRKGILLSRKFDGGQQ